MSFEIVWYSLADLHYFSSLLVPLITKQAIQNLLLTGDYGVGKTTFIRSLVEQLHAREPFEISSPSFTTYNIYPTVPSCIHVDLYNAHNSLPSILDELDCIDNPFFCIEWAEYISYPLEGATLSCLLSYADEEQSRIVQCTTFAISKEHVDFILNSYRAYITR